MALECGGTQTNRLVVPTREITVWAGQAFHEVVTSDGSTVPGSDTLKYPDGPIHGQVGWDVCINFDDLADLARLLHCGLELPRSPKLKEDKSVCGNWLFKCSPTNLRAGEISRLGIFAHGDASRNWAANGAHRNVIEDPITGMMHLDELVFDNPVNSDNAGSTYRASLEMIGRATLPDATIILMGCCLGGGARGTKLLTTLAEIWHGRTVVGFTTFGYMAAQIMATDRNSAVYPGMSLTHERDILVGQQSSQKEKWNLAWAADDRSVTCWASEFSEHAKAVRVERKPDGSTTTRFLRWPKGDEPEPILSSGESSAATVKSGSQAVSTAADKSSKGPATKLERKSGR